MLSDIIARVDELHLKAAELGDKGYLLRAAEIYGRAAEAARALGADNVAATSLRLSQGAMLATYATSAPDDTSEPRILAKHRAAYIALLSGAVETLARRRLTGTLLEGKCLAAEEAWFVFQMQRQSVKWPAAAAASWAKLVGYEQFLHAANTASLVLRFPCQFAAECSAKQHQSFAQHIVHAAALMQLPRFNGTVAMQNEVTFTRNLLRTVAEAGDNGLDARLVQLTAGALQQLQRSGVLQARSIENHFDTAAFKAETMAYGAIVLKSLNAPDLRRCALPGCGAREAHPAHFKSCAACRTVVYCCREHQVEGWLAHKKACKAVRKAQSAEDEAGPIGA